MDNYAITVEHLSKHFNPGLSSGTIKTALLDFAKGKKSKSRQEHTVLKDINFSVGKGEFIGIIGRNGSGKSTLLKLLAGVYSADSGSVKVHGTLTPFIELGVGFNPELTGKNNIYLNGALLGFSRQDMDKMYDDIVQFAELQEFMEEKLKNYSSGMQVRLAFSIAIKVNSDVLLIDEVLAVGDVKFQKKCYDVFNSFKKSGKTVVFVSHAMPQVEEFCDRVIVINNGKILFDGNKKKAVKIYDGLNKQKDGEETVLPDTAPISYRSGNGEAELSEYAVDKSSVVVGESLRFNTDIAVHESISSLYLGVSVYKEDRVQSVFAISEKLKPQAQHVSVSLGDLALTPGNYFISAGITGKPDQWKDHYDLLEKQIEFTVVPKKDTTKYNLGPTHIAYKVRTS